MEGTAELLLHLKAYDYRLAREDLAHFTKAAWPIVEPGTEIQWNTRGALHHDAICIHVKAVVNFVTNRWPDYPKIQHLIINVPFGSTKTTIVNKMLCPWVWTFSPSTKFLFISHGDDLSTESSMDARTIIDSQWYQDGWGNIVKIAKDQKEKTRFWNTKRGFRLCFGMTSGGTGEHGDVLVFDDPHDAEKAVYSAVTLEQAVNAYKVKWSSRRTIGRPTAIILIMQRLNVLDLSGFLMKLGGWEHLRIPFKYEPEAPCETSIGWKDPRTRAGELYWPDQYTEDWYKKQVPILGPFGIAGQLQQRPTPMGGGMVSLDWFNRYEEPPVRAEMIKKVQFWDTAHKGDELIHSPWVCLTACITVNGFYILDIYREWHNFPDGKQMAIQLARREAIDMVVIEDRATGQDLLQELPREANFTNWVPFQAESWFMQMDKVARLGHSSDVLRAKRVWLPKDAPWLQCFEEEIQAAGPAAAAMDQCDCLSMMLKTFRGIDVSLGVSEYDHGKGQDWPDEDPDEEWDEIPLDDW
jgi:hypothetical protein